MPPRRNRLCKFRSRSVDMLPHGDGSYNAFADTRRYLIRYVVNPAQLQCYTIMSAVKTLRFTFFHWLESSSNVCATKRLKNVTWRDGVFQIDRSSGTKRFHVLERLWSRRRETNKKTVIMFTKWTGRTINDSVLRIWTSWKNEHRGIMANVIGSCACVSIPSRVNETALLMLMPLRLWSFSSFVFTSLSVSIIYSRHLDF